MRENPKDDIAEDFLRMVTRFCDASPVMVNETAAAIVVAVYLGVGSDSRSLSNRLGIAHALVLREIGDLTGEFLTVEKRDARTQRTWIELTARSRLLLEELQQ